LKDQLSAEATGLKSFFGPVIEFLGRTGRVISFGSRRKEKEEKNRLSSGELRKRKVPSVQSYDDLSGGCRVRVSSRGGGEGGPDFLEFFAQQLKKVPFIIKNSSVKGPCFRGGKGGAGKGSFATGGGEVENSR